LLRFIREILIVFQPAPSLRQILVETLPHSVRAWQLQLLPIHRLQVLQIIPGHQLILGDGEKRLSLPVRSAQGRDHKPARVRPAEKDAARGHRFENLAGK